MNAHDRAHAMALFFTAVITIELLCIALVASQYGSLIGDLWAGVAAAGASFMIFLTIEDRLGFRWSHLLW